VNCPRCDAPLEHKKLKGIEIDRCSECKGLWLDHPELDELEDTVLDNDQLKGTMVYAVRSSDITCPVCNGVMRTFNYRAYDLPIDECEAQHGFWLDENEEKRVLELMKQRTKDIKRSRNAEGEWASLLGSMKTKSFSDKMRNLFK
jgi:Zn-finger nucleic acid-binding protein